MDIADIIQQYSTVFMDKYQQHLLPSHRRAMDAILACRRD